MHITRADGTVVNAECSLGVLDGEHCVIVESSGGASPSRGILRRNPDYNEALTLILQRLAKLGVSLTRIVLDSNKVRVLPVTDRIVPTEEQLPIALEDVDTEDLRKRVQRTVAMMHRDPNATAGGNAQKRLRICLDRAVRAESLIFDVPTEGAVTQIPDSALDATETERSYMRAARVGQGPFRKALLAEFSGRCPLTGINNPALLRASHIKPWYKCTNEERLDPMNGLLLSVVADALFDSGLITFGNAGDVVISPLLSDEDRQACRIGSWASLPVAPKREGYLEFHRISEFQLKTTHQ